MKVEQETEAIDFIALEPFDIKDEILEPEFIDEEEVSDQENESNHEGNQFTCTEENCNRKFLCKRSLIVHKNSNHSHNKKFWCCQCDQIYPSKSKMLNCLSRHPVDEEGFNCPECSSYFSTEAEMFRHRQKKHGSIFYCKSCKVSYNTKEELVRCQKLHYAKKQSEVYVNCPECDKKLKKYSLRLHLTFYHSNKREHQCQVSLCDKLDMILGGCP